ncbi:MAG: alpha/beta fold hydrolase [Lachnospiraceae bacterium]|nr:alpha/beta fold hydrolase [Lachnospiraceae bacterium]
MNENRLQNGSADPVRGALLRTGGRSIPYIWNLREEHTSALLCLHGFAGSKDSSVIAALRDSLDRKGIGVVTFDWPAHGESDAPDNFLTVENCLSDLDHMVGRIRRQTRVPLSCFATSFGGYLATLYRNGHPNAFERLILRSPALKMSKVFRGLLPDEDFAAMMRGEKIVMGYERKMSLGRDFYESLCGHDAFSPDPPAPENILILQGDRDDVVDPADTIAYAERTGAGIRVFPGADHLYQKPGEKARIVKEAELFLYSNANNPPL